MRYGLYFLIFILLNQYLCSDGVHIVGRWCSKPCTEVKYTLDSVYIWLITRHCTHYRCPRSGSLPFQNPPLIFHPILVRLCRHLCHIPWTRQINALLFPPPHTHPCPLLPLYRLAEVHKRLRSNVLHDRIMPFRMYVPIVSNPASVIDMAVEM